MKSPAPLPPLTFTRSEKLRIIRALARTRSLREIGAVIGVSGEWVRVLMVCDGIKPNTRAEAARLVRRRPQASVSPVRRTMKRRSPNSKHSDELRARVKGLKGIKSASVIAAEFGLVSRNVVIGLWNRPS
jgi:hypothetical protein